MKQLSKPEVVVVTGASAELGRAITRELARGAFGERASASFPQQWANKESPLAVDRWSRIGRCDSRSVVENGWEAVRFPGRSFADSNRLRCGGSATRSFVYRRNGR